MCHCTAGSKPGWAMCLCRGSDKNDYVSLSLCHSMHTTNHQTNKADLAYFITARSQNCISFTTSSHHHSWLYSNLLTLKGVYWQNSDCSAAVGCLLSRQTRSPTCGRCQEASMGRRHRQRCRRCHPSSYLQAGRHSSLPGQCGQECGGGVQGGT